MSLIALIKPKHPITRTPLNSYARWCSCYGQKLGSVAQESETFGPRLAPTVSTIKRRLQPKTVIGTGPLKGATATLRLINLARLLRMADAFPEKFVEWLVSAAYIRNNRHAFVDRQYSCCPYPSPPQWFLDHITSGEGIRLPPRYDFVLMYTIDESTRPPLGIRGRSRPEIGWLHRPE